MLSFFRRDAVNQGGVQWIIAGLGNPGAKYDRTRHNVGFITLDLLASGKNAKVDRVRFKSLTGTCEMAGDKVLLMKPQTFMNNSGEAVRDAAEWYKVPPQRVIIISDDVNLSPGRLRVRAKGSDGGHNGLKSIIYLLNSDEFPRVRVGVGMPPGADFSMPDWVLGKFSDEDGKAVTDAIKRAVGAVEEIMAKGTESAASRFNGSLYQQK